LPGAQFGTKRLREGYRCRRDVLRRRKGCKLLLDISRHRGERETRRLRMIVMLERGRLKVKLERVLM